MVSLGLRKLVERLGFPGENESIVVNCTQNLDILYGRGVYGQWVLVQYNQVCLFANFYGAFDRFLEMLVGAPQGHRLQGIQQVTVYAVLRELDWYE